MSMPVDVYWSFRSPYSYLATPGMLAIQRDFDVEVNLRVVLPLAVRAPDFFSPENAKRGRYIMKDWPRTAEFLGMPHAWPSPDPIVQDMKTLEVAEEQPYIYRLSRLGIEAQRRGRGIEFASQISSLLFGGTRDWHLNDHLAKASARAGVELAEMERAIDGGTHLEEVEANQRRLEESGHWGVPTLVFEGEPFFGQDRIEILRWRLDQRGLARA